LSGIEHFAALAFVVAARAFHERAVQLTQRARQFLPIARIRHDHPPFREPT
jgi:hypothetical protein